MTMQTMTVTTTAPSPETAARAPAAPSPAGTPPAAPAPAPEASPAPAPVVATTIEAAPAPTHVASPAPSHVAGPVEYAPTGDAGLDMALGFLGKLGINGDDPAMKAAEAGDFEMLSAKLALMGDKAKGWEQIVALGKQSYGRVQDTQKADAAKTQDAILSAFGTDKAEAAKQWETVRAWAKENAEPHERSAVNAALAAGGIAAKAMAMYLQQLHRGSATATIDPAVVTRMASTSSNDSGALSPAQYKTATAELRAKLGGGMELSPEYKSLQARRLAYRA